MRKTILIISFMSLLSALIVTAVMAEFRHTREEEFIRKTFYVNEKEVISNRITVCDPDGDTVLIEVDESDIPDGMTFGEMFVIPEAEIPIEDPNCAECFEDTGSSWFGLTYTWEPTYEQSGTYSLHVHAVDSNGGEEWVVFVINVVNKNRPPIL